MSEHVCSVVLLVLLVRRWMCLCLSSLPPFFSVISLVCYGSYVACWVCGGRTLFPFPLSLIVVVWYLLSLGSRLLVRRVFQWPPWSSSIPPPAFVGVGRWACVVCDLALWYWQRSWLPLSSCVSVPLCVPLYCCFSCLATCVSRRVSRDLS